VVAGWVLTAIGTPLQGTVRHYLGAKRRDGCCSR